jgi:hypothetical protein
MVCPFVLPTRATPPIPCVPNGDHHKWSVLLSSQPVQPLPSRASPTGTTTNGLSFCPPNPCVPNGDHHKWSVLLSSQPVRPQRGPPQMVCPFVLPTRASPTAPQMVWPLVLPTRATPPIPRVPNGDHHKWSVLLSSQPVRPQRGPRGQPGAEQSDAPGTHPPPWKAP